LRTSIEQATQSQTPMEFEAEKARKTNRKPNSYIMSLLAAAAAAQENLPDEQFDEESQEVASTNSSPKLKGPNQMEAEDNEELGKHLNKFVEEQEEEEEPKDGEISFGPSHSFFRPPSFSRTMVAQDLRTPNLPFIFWASIRLPLPATPTNATDAMFNELDEFITKMQEADQKYSIFPHNLSQYGSLESLPPIIDDPEVLPSEVDDWLVYFPQAKPRFQGGNVYTTALCEDIHHGHVQQCHEPAGNSASTKST